MLRRLFMACLISRALILISLRLVGAQIWILGRLIGAWIVQRGLEMRELFYAALTQINGFSSLA